MIAEGLYPKTEIPYLLNRNAVAPSTGSNFIESYCLIKIVWSDSFDLNISQEEQNSLLFMLLG